MEKLAYNQKEAAEVLGVCKQTIEKLVRNGEIHAVRPSKNRIIIPVEALKEYLASANKNDRS